jgi:hypothetical protein
VSFNFLLDYLILKRQSALPSPSGTEGNGPKCVSGRGLEGVPKESDLCVIVLKRCIITSVESVCSLNSY